MTPFAQIEKAAAKRKGGRAALEELLPSAKSSRSLQRIGDDRYLAEMTRGVFQAGFVWRVIEAKWDGFEEAFLGFDPGYWKKPPRKHLAALVHDERIVRNMQKIQTVPKNAAMICAIADEHGSFGKWVAKWPSNDMVGLFAYLKKNGARLGGMTSQYFLRRMGKDTFMVTNSTGAALELYGVTDTRSPKSKKDMLKVQEAFNAWADESGRSFCEISRILACSVDA